jgi:uncharacterized cupin superfamily protein
MTNIDSSIDARRQFLIQAILGTGAAITGVTNNVYAAAPVGTPGHVFSGSTGVEEWVPFKFMQDGKENTFGDMVLFRSVGSAGNGLAVGLWRAPDGDTPIYTSEAGDETFLVLNGEATIDFLDLNESKTYKVGDVCAWSQNSRTRWHLSGNFKKFFVVAKASA